ncbi:hypothetical protein U1Q18_018248, partial [Sarracenia purpurea var. burkii]
TPNVQGTAAFQVYKHLLPMGLSWYPLNEGHMDVLLLRSDASGGVLIAATQALNLSFLCFPLGHLRSKGRTGVYVSDVYLEPSQPVAHASEHTCKGSYFWMVMEFFLFADSQKQGYKVAMLLRSGFSDALLEIECTGCLCFRPYLQRELLVVVLLEVVPVAASVGIPQTRVEGGYAAEEFSDVLLEVCAAGLFSFLISHWSLHNLWLMTLNTCAKGAICGGSGAGALCFRPNMQRELREVVFLVFLGGPPRLSVVPQFLAACV